MLASNADRAGLDRISSSILQVDAICSAKPGVPKSTLAYETDRILDGT